MPVATLPDPAAVRVPPADQLRSQLRDHMLATHILRGLIRLAESVERRASQRTAARKDGGR